MTTEHETPHAAVYLKTPDAATYCGVHSVTLRRAAARGDVKAVRQTPGGHWRFRREDLDRWIAGETR